MLMGKYMKPDSIAIRCSMGCKLADEDVSDVCVLVEQQSHLVPGLR